MKTQQNQNILSSTTTPPTKSSKTVVSELNKSKKECNDWINLLVKDAVIRDAQENKQTKRKRKQKQKQEQKQEQKQSKSNTKKQKTKHSQICKPNEIKSNLLLTKAERIEKRKLKKKRRMQRLDQMDTKKHFPKRSSSNHDNLQFGTQKQNLQEMKDNLNYLSQMIHEIVIQHQTNQHSNMYIAKDMTVKGKAVAGQIQLFPPSLPTLQLKESITSKKCKYHERIQPRKRDYGGLGLARPSIGISLRDPSFIPKLEQEFAEHINGFFGKQRTKAMKKQLNGNMLWRQLASAKQALAAQNNNKQNHNSILQQKVNGVKLMDMTTEQRVDAMIKAKLL